MECQLLDTRRESKFDISDSLYKILPNGLEKEEKEQFDEWSSKLPPNEKDLVTKIAKFFRFFSKNNTYASNMLEGTALAAVGSSVMNDNYNDLDIVLAGFNHNYPVRSSWAFENESFFQTGSLFVDSRLGSGVLSEMYINFAAEMDKSGYRLLPIGNKFFKTRKENGNRIIRYWFHEVDIGDYEIYVYLPSNALIVPKGEEDKLFSAESPHPIHFMIAKAKSLGEWEQWQKENGKPYLLISRL